MADSPPEGAWWWSVRWKHERLHLEYTKIWQGENIKSTCPNLHFGISHNFDFFMHLHENFFFSSITSSKHSFYHFKCSPILGVLMITCFLKKHGCRAKVFSKHLIVLISMYCHETSNYIWDSVVNEGAQCRFIFFLPDYFIFYFLAAHFRYNHIQFTNYSSK